MTFKYEVKLPQGIETFGGVPREQIEGNVIAALEAWSAVLMGKGTLVLAIELHDRPGGKFSGASKTRRETPRNGRKLCEDSAAVKLREGTTLPGTEVADAFITIQPESDYFRKVWFDPEPNRQGEPPIPHEFNDAISLFMHEFAHCLGMVSFRDLATGELSTEYISVFDTMIEGCVRTGFWFGGRHTRKVYDGSSVPITFMQAKDDLPANFSHYGNRSDRHPLIFERLMYGPSFLGPIHEVVESWESVVIHCRAPESERGGARCGQESIAGLRKGAVCVIPAI